ncbi:MULTISPECIES: Hpt domain-containing protein [unclassified Campylobacter]|uniref:Hpt domain-containing protein n=1 Tax=unclassified Campylobacter TaxID=2593542 RepID=UPI001BDAD15C|nr:MULTISPECIES: Hpt domain-containing protein [unclassified Campylobacter]MBZ7977757.1 Hpt domain-containing protein [Campylobacter sp. RM12654]MBZ7979690.1 Hpt domain-containing protein [Campylobacter sp. RM12642]MBZ7981619.1 Hpt domain-containing protein [Campylobacter sp. RM12640]MBZ7984315.1 Hpt domain-containing protein [Campylobacter sp. RM12647]MBZ7988406.1 Hpt domain-containing protein [Campylobacter sp. RM12635]MBZ7991446.1 Hpt domain-containing protein [Campylobacter sp. RM9331]MB
MNKNLGLLGQLELEFDFDIVDDFMTHFNIFCDSLEPVIIALEDEDKYKNKVNELFRMFHNMKSASGFLKINQFVNICKIVEDVLDEARDMRGPASDELVDWLLFVTDQFMIYKRDFNDNNPYLSALNPKIIHLPQRLNK